MLYIFCNTISSQDAMVCSQCYCVLLNAQWVDLIQKSKNGEIFRGLKGKLNYTSQNIPSERNVQELFTPIGSAGLLTLDADPY